VDATQAIIARIERAFKATAQFIQPDALLKPPSLLGFSNGGFFAALLASDARLEFSALAVAQGGDVAGQHFTPERARPTLLLFAKGDVHQFPRMRKLEAALNAAGWKPESFVREGAHSFTADDIKVAIDFLSR
jgi:dienelactone hydrolase